ncbi:MAG: hypothetical protein IK118_05140 [Clostridia bacterium]|nr:hypothetical protein [Clostridia bacterium]
MAARQIVNIINFIRAVERYPGTDEDKREAVRNQIRIMDELSLKGTFLILYDVFEDEEYMRLMRSLDPERYEIGIWFEIEQFLCEASGLVWRGKTRWEQYCDTGYPMGYTKDERKRIIDEFFRRFKAEFGYYPRVFGTWFCDSFTLRYISETYGLDAACNCKEQYGTDGYTLWGGYYAQGYYPSSKNIFMPAQKKENQLNVPVFRMLGSDPVYQYDFGLDVKSEKRAAQKVITLEPAYPDRGGGCPAWTDWYFKENFNGECLSFGYAQAGQENCFQWSGMKDGIEYQFPKIAELQKQGKIVAERLGETGKWYKETFPVTPASAVTAHGAFDDPGKSSVWYNSRFYRVNLYCEDGRIWIRDLHAFCETAADPYENTVCETKAAIYETLPVADGFVLSGHGVRSGLYLYDKNTGALLACEEMKFTETGEGECAVECGDLRFRLFETGFEIARKGEFVLKNVIARTEEHCPAVLSYNEKELRLAYLGIEYGVRLTSGIFRDPMTVVSENGKVCIADIGYRIS